MDYLFSPLMTDHLLNRNLKQLCGAENVIGFSDIITDEIKRTLYVQKRRIRIKVIHQDDLFEPEVLKSSFPNIRSFIENNQSIVEKAVQRMPVREISFLPKTDDKCAQSHNTLKVHLHPHDMILQNASYIVVGGLTGLGWGVVKWLARTGAGQVITMSRRKPDDKITQRIENTIKMYHITITSVQCDICDLDNLKAVLAKLEKGQCLPIKGIYQVEGILQDRFLTSMTKDKIDAVLLPKVLGTLNLHIATLQLPIDQFVLHSSIASVIGNPG